ncbi:signal peptide peptidase SppA [Bdellovibrionota bacterium]
MSRRSWVLVVLILAVVLSLCSITALGILYAIFGDVEDSFGGHNVAIVDVKGVITEARPTIRRLEKLTKESGIKGIVVRIESPGGVVGPTQEIYSAILQAREKKHVVTSFGGVAASGGYYVALAGEKIISNPGTLTGSLGVKMEFANLEGLYEWAKINPFTLKSGKYKDIGSPSRPMTPEERRLLDNMLKDVHNQFRDAVKENRKLDDRVLSLVTDGRIFSGRQALEYGLVDELGGIQVAIKSVAELANVKVPKVLYPTEPRRSVWKFLMESVSDINNLLPTQRKPHPSPMFIME